MRLINARTLKLEVFQGRRPPPYAIVSHRWENEEVGFENIQCGKFEDRKGYYKLNGACRKALKYGCEWVWLDTCCIDKSSSSELTEAINSMYQWYKAAEICLVFLYDYQIDNGENYFEHCEWFSRGWTLQELIAPANLVFFDRRWKLVGIKAELCETLARITGIDIAVLRGADPASCSVAQRMSWAAGRATTKIEDQAYCLLGLFNVSMPMLYGEGARSFLKLQEEIIRYANDHTIFAWDRCFPVGRRSGLLAHSPACFAACQDIVQAERFSGPLQGFSMTNIGISINLFTIPYAMNTYFAVLECCHKHSPARYYGILLERLAVVDQYVRVDLDGQSVVSINLEDLEGVFEKRRRALLVRQVQLDLPLMQNHAFWIRSMQLPGYGRTELTCAKLFSRDDYVSRHDGWGVLKIPNSLYGTAGVLQLRSKESDKSWWRIEYLVFGFDEEFVPHCMLGNSELGKASSHGFVRQVTQKKGERTAGAGARFSNSWLRGKPRKPSRNAFKRDSCCIISTSSMDQGEVVVVDFLNLAISFQQVPVPEELECLAPRPWTVWAIDLRRSEGPSPQALAEQDMMASGATSVRRAITEGLPKWSRQALLGSIGAEALAELA